MKNYTQIESNIEVKKAKIRELENSIEKEKNQYIDLISSNLGFKKMDVIRSKYDNDMLNKDKKYQIKDIIIDSFTLSYTPRHQLQFLELELESEMKKEVKDLDKIKKLEENINKISDRKKGLYAYFYEITKNKKRNKINKPEYNKEYIEDYIKVGEYDMETDTINYF